MGFMSEINCVKAGNSVLNDLSWLLVSHEVKAKDNKNTGLTGVSDTRANFSIPLLMKSLNSSTNNQDFLKGHFRTRENNCAFHIS